jgi:large subunit ribosomal protein L32
MAVPKRKKSKSRVRMRRRSNAHRLTVAATSPCPQCGAPRLPHRVCPGCGYYRGRQVLTVTTD